MKILVTGSAGFIGYHLVKYLVERGDEVVGLDNINDYYDVNLKYGRLADCGIDKKRLAYGKAVRSEKFSNYRFVKMDLIDLHGLKELFDIGKFDAVCNLAAQAGVRYSLINPQAYIDSNIQGFLNILECCRHSNVKNLSYASSSSVYGLNKNMPFSTSHNVDHPVSLYAASKKSNELMAHTYSYLFNIQTTGLRFFTVYGPWGRPDMALFLFTKAIIEDKPIQVFNNGVMKRDFTYIDDIIEGIVRVIDNPSESNANWDGQQPDASSSIVPYRVLNIGRGNPMVLMDFILEIEKNLGKKALKEFLPLQDGDVKETWSDINYLENVLDYKPKVNVADGVKNFIDWYKQFYSELKEEPVISDHLNTILN